MTFAIGVSYDDRMSEPLKLVIVSLTEPRQYLTAGKEWSPDRSEAVELDWREAAELRASLPKGVQAAPVPAKDA
ncbi:MAG: hypothetical protein ACJAVC_001255 [Brevundimonas sp.]